MMIGGTYLLVKAKKKSSHTIKIALLGHSEEANGERFLIILWLEEILSSYSLEIQHLLL